MSKKSIIVKRDGINGFLSNNFIGTDALNALLSIDGVRELEIVKESEEQVELAYIWIGSEKFWGITERLQEFGLSIMDSDK